MKRRGVAMTLKGPLRDGRRPHLQIREPEQTSAVVLVMHGGKVSSGRPARWNHLSVVRMRPFARAVERRGRSNGVAVWSLLFACRGWNGDGAPVADALWALNEIEARYGSVPVVLLGHSMGGRTAIRVAGHPSVIGVVGLAPWLPEGEPIVQLADRALSIIHGTSDVVIPIELSRAFASKLGGGPTEVELIALRGTGHTMLRRARRWHGLASGAVDRMLTHGTRSGQRAGVVTSGVDRRLPTGSREPRSVRTE